MAGPKYPHEYLPPEVWDQIFKPRGPFGLLSGRTVLDAIPGVSQGLAYQDYQQSSREGDGIGRILAGAGMLPGGGFFKGMKGPIRKMADKLDDVIVEFRGEKFRYPPGTDPIKAQQELWAKVAGPRARGAEEVVDNYPSDLPDETFDNLMAPEKADVIPFPKKPSPRWDPIEGMGNTPNSGPDFEYRGGFVREMTPKQFLMHTPAHAYGVGMDDRYKSLLKGYKEGKAIAPPNLDVKWDPKNKVWRVKDHEGRHRSLLVMQEYGDDVNMPVRILPHDADGRPMKQGKGMTEEMLKAPIIPQGMEEWP